MKKEVPFYLKLVGVVFLYSLMTGLFVQLVLLPYLTPHLHAGFGLMKAHDWITYHEVAFKLSEKIRAQGWSAWELRPQKLLEPGLLAPLYVYLPAKPLSLLPFNALLHSLTALVVFLLVKGLVPGKKWVAATAILPFAFFPSSLLWVTQILKDGLAFWGCLLFVLGLRFLVQFRSLWLTSACLYLGAAIGSMTRPYLCDLFVLQLYAVAFICTLFLSTLKPGAWKTVFFIWVLAFSLKPLIHADLFSIDQEAQKLSTLPEIETYWKRTPYLPESWDLKLQKIGRVRYGYSVTPGKTNLDSDVRFKEAKDLFLYLPRALQISLFAPFPHSISNSEGQSESALAKKMVRWEMILTYLLFPFVLFEILRKRILAQRIEAFVLFFSLMSFLLLYAVSIPNMGTLHRFRYGFLTALLSFGPPCLISTGEWLIGRLTNAQRSIKMGRLSTRTQG